MRSVFSGLVIVLVAALAGGCVSAGQDPSKMSPADLQAFVTQNQGMIQTGAMTVTAVSLTQVKDQADRAKVAQFVYSLASAVDQGVESDTIDLTKLRAVATDLVTQSKLQNKVVAGLIVNGVADLVQTELNTRYSSLTTDDRTKVAKALLQAVAKGVMNATQSSVPVVPTTAPVS